jgi:hypothetical protein
MSRDARVYLEDILVSTPRIPGAAGDTRRTLALLAQVPRVPRPAVTILPPWA